MHYSAAHNPLNPASALKQAIGNVIALNSAQ
jgi:hypothetical protein